jgi:hypothetical protein
VRTGAPAGQPEHWLKDGPEQLAQSGWQATQVPVALKLFEGHDVTHCPFDASKLFVQVRQKFDAPVHVLQEVSHASGSPKKVSHESDR